MMLECMKSKDISIIGNIRIKDKAQFSYSALTLLVG